MPFPAQATIVPGGSVLIEKQTLTGSAQFTFAGIPQNFDHLMVVAMIRGAQAVTDSGRGRGTASTDQFAGIGGGMWLSTSAITSILLWQDSGAGEFSANSTATLYGMI